MSRGMRKFLALVAIITLLTGCSVYTSTKSLFVSGVSLQALGEQFVAVSEQVAEGCDGGVIPVHTCDKYKAFFDNFVKVYPLTVKTWEAAKNAGDVATQGKAEDVARSLAKDLTELAIEALGSLAPEVK